MTFCIQCSMKALLAMGVAGASRAGTFDESPEEHVKRCHPDPVETQRERRELERRLAEKKQRGEL